MGQMGNIPVLGDEFNTYFPFLMVAFSSMIAANAFNRFLDLFGGSKRFHFDDEDRADDFTASGNIILRKGDTFWGSPSLQSILFSGENVRSSPKCTADL